MADDPEWLDRVIRYAEQESQRIVDPRATLLPSNAPTWEPGMLSPAVTNPSHTVPSGSVSESHGLTNPTSVTSTSDRPATDWKPPENPQPVSRTDNVGLLNHLGSGVSTRPDIAETIVIEDSPALSSAEGEPEPRSVPPETGTTPQHETQAEQTHEQSLLTDLEYVSAVFPIILSQEDRGQDLLLQTLRRLENLKGHVHVLVRSILASNTGASQTGPPGRNAETYRCRQCVTKGKPALFTVKRGTFKRHVMEQHRACTIFHCPNTRCEAISYRRCRIKEHFENSHGRRATDLEIDHNTSEPAPPPLCDICHCTVNGWDNFYDCFISHCVYPTSRPGNRGNGRARRTRRAPNRRRSNLPRRRAGGISTAVQPPEEDVVPTGGVQEAPPESRETNNYRHDSGNPQALQAIDIPPGHNTSTQPSLLCCLGCRHPFATCNECSLRTENSNRCHACPPRNAIPQADNGSGPGFYGNDPFLGQGAPLSYTFDPNYFNYYFTPQPEQGFNPQGRSSWEGPGNQTRQLRHVNNYQVGLMTDVAVPDLAEVDMGYGLMCEPKTLHPVDAWIRRLPIKKPVTGGLATLLQELSKLTLSDKISTPQRGLSLTTIRSPPTFECNCPCRTAAMLQEDHSGRAIASLAPGKRLEMDLRILTPENRGQTQTLRTRVQIIVKLLKPQATAAKVSAEKESKEARQALEQALESKFNQFELFTNERPDTKVDESDVSDVETVFDEGVASMQSSCSGLSTLAPTRPGSPTYEENSLSDEASETTEVSFDLDLDSSLDRMSQLTGGLPDGVCSDPTSMDPAQVLEFFFKYVLYVMAAMSRSVDHGHGPCLGQ